MGKVVIAENLLTPFTRLLTALEPSLASIGIESAAGWAEPAATSISVTLVLILITILQVIMGELVSKIGGDSISRNGGDGGDGSDANHPACYYLHRFDCFV